MAEGNDEVFEILIKFGLDDQAARQAANQIQGLKQHTKEGGHEIAVFNTHGKEMHRLMHEIAHQSPITGLALRAAFHPAAIGIVGLMVAFKEIEKAIEEHKKKLEEAAEAQRKVMTAGWDAAAKATESAIKVAEKYFETIAKVENKTAKIVTDTERLMKLNEAFGAKEVEQLELKFKALQKLEELLKVQDERLKAATARQGAIAGSPEAAKDQAWAATQAGLVGEALKKQQEAARAARPTAAEFGGVHPSFTEEHRKKLDEELDAANRELIEARRLQAENNAKIREYNKALAEAAKDVERESEQRKETIKQIEKFNNELGTAVPVLQIKGFMSSMGALNTALQSLGINMQSTIQMTEEIVRQQTIRREQAKSALNNPT